MSKILETDSEKLQNDTTRKNRQIMEKHQRAADQQYRQEREAAIMELYKTIYKPKGISLKTVKKAFGVGWKFQTE